MSASAGTRSKPWDLASAIRIERIANVEWPYIDTAAEGPALVLLPGSVGTCEVFFKQIAALGRDLRIVAVSYPTEPSPARLADGLAGLTDRLGLASASVLGSSFGGHWAQYFALRHPRRVENLFLGNTFDAPDELFSNPLFAPDWIRTTSAENLQKFWRERVEAAPDSELKLIQRDMLSGRQSPSNLKARFLGVADAKPCPPLPLPDSRIVVIDCADDPIIPPDSRRAMRNRYAAAEHHTLQIGGHYPHILNPDAYNAIILKRLKSASG